MELDSERVRMKNIRETYKFIWEKKVDFFLIAPGFNLSLYHYYYLRGVFQIDPTQGNVGVNIFKNTDLLILQFISPFLFLLYYSVDWVWESAEIKIADVNKDTAIRRRNQFEDEFEINEINFASNSLKNIVLFFTGVNAINWAISIDQQFNPDQSLVYSFINYFYLFVVVSSGYSIFIGVMYFRSSIHERIVNNLRTAIWKDYSKSLIDNRYHRKYNITVMRTRVPEVLISNNYGGF